MQGKKGTSVELIVEKRDNPIHTELSLGSFWLVLFAPRGISSDFFFERQRNKNVEVVGKPKYLTYAEKLANELNRG